MNHQTHMPQSSLADPQHGLPPMAPIAAEGSVIAIDTPIAADRIYQLAAVTAGLFFLATLL